MPTAEEIEAELATQAVKSGLAARATQPVLVAQEVSVAISGLQDKVKSELARKEVKGERGAEVFKLEVSPMVVKSGQLPKWTRLIWPMKR